MRKKKTSSDCDKFIVGDMNDVISSERLGVGLVGIADERSNARPGAQYIAASHLNVRVQVVLDLFEYECDVVFVRRRSIGELARRVGRAGHGVLLPRQEEDHSAVARVRVEKAHVLRRVVVGQHDVHARARLADLASDRVVHLADLVCVRSRCVYNAFSSIFLKINKESNKIITSFISKFFIRLSVPT